MVSRFEVYLVNLDDEVTADAKNTRPAVVVSPDEMNRNLANVIIAPLSTAGAPYPTRVPVTFLNNERTIVLDQLRAVDKGRLVKKIGDIDGAARDRTLDILLEIFAR